MSLQLGGTADKYEYRALTLPNKLRVLLSHDKSADKAAVSMSVKVGSYSDPRAHPGLAHFLEHMLFMGTEEHPDENAYMEYIHIHNGSSNANTSDEITNYFYDIDASYLRESMHIFSGFFTSPLIREDAISRELQAVNSEHSANILLENWRKYHLLSLLSRPDYPSRKFGVGNSETLASASREDLLEFWKYFYTPDRMCLAVHGSDSLDTLEQWVGELFGKISPREGAYIWDCPAYVPPLSGRTGLDYLTFDASFLGKLVLYRPAVNIPMCKSTLSIFISLPEGITNFRKKTVAYFGELLEGTGSDGFVGVLLREGIASNVSVYLEETTINTVVQVSVELVDDKVAQVPTILQILRSYILMIQKNGTPELYSTFKNINEKVLDSKESLEPLELVESAAQAMHFYPTEECLKYPHVWEGFDADDFSQILETALDAQKWMVLFRTGSIKCENIRVDEIYGINYAVTEMPAVDSVLLEGVCSKMKWSFGLPEEVDISHARKTSAPVPLGAIPANIPEYPAGEIRHEEVLRPGCSGHLLHNPKYSRNAHVRVMLCTDAHIFNEKTYAGAVGYFLAVAKMFQEKYRAEMSASLLNLEESGGMSGFVFQFSGTPVVIEDLVEKFFAEYASGNMQMFNLSKESAVSFFQSETRKSPYMYSMGGVYTVRGYPEFEPKALVEAAGSILPENIWVVRDANVKVLGVGNITPTEFTRIVDGIGKHISFVEGPKETVERKSDISVETVDIQNVAVSVFHVVAAPDAVQAYALAILLVQIFSERFFDEVRTKEEYGYIVFMGQRVLRQRAYVHFTVQSDRDIEDVAARIQAFVGEIQGRVREMPAQEYEAHRESAILAVREEASNLEDYAEEVFQLWMKIGFHPGNKERVCAAVKNISQEALVQYTEKITDIVTVRAAKPGTHGKTFPSS
ncbi:insulysin [Nematocida major]|uniref:insulysin n=1 Tax=Nematocida major TaxID=1912982 RepID=UPI0020079E18|nr:insulysin [Nematocida major]KAH9385673.1 insulysin [Nematocida major]